VSLDKEKYYHLGFGYVISSMLGFLSILVFEGLNERLPTSELSDRKLGLMNLLLLI
jgi:hypothetical protein